MAALIPPPLKMKRLYLSTDIADNYALKHIRMCMAKINKIQLTSAFDAIIAKLLDDFDKDSLKHTAIYNRLLSKLYGLSWNNGFESEVTYDALYTALCSLLLPM